MLSPQGLSKDATRLRDVLESAIERHDRAGAADALRKLAAIEADEPRWPHRLGETLSRLGRSHEAEEAYVQASAMYASKGFLARAIAVAKLAVELNPARADLLSNLDPEPAQSLRKIARAAAVSPALAPVVAAVQVHALEPRADAADDEVGFDDAPDSCTIEVQLVDFDYSLLDEGTEPIEQRKRSVAPAPPQSLREPPLDAERLARMSGATLFADVPRDALADIAREAERVALPDGALILAKGGRADALLVVVEGHAEVRIEGMGPVLVGEGDVLGETTILADAVRTADVRARGDFVALRVNKEALDRIVAKHPEVGDVLFGLLARRLVSTALETTPLFAPFDPETRAEIARAFEVRRARAGTVLQEKGKKSDGLYLVLSGAARARAGEGDAAEPLTHGALVGHEMLLARAPAPRTVTIETEAVVLRLPATKFTAFVTEYPPALAYLSSAPA